MTEKATILGVPVASVTMRQAVDILSRAIDDYRRNGGAPLLVATANAEMIMMATQNPSLMAVLQTAGLVVPDGAGTVWAARQLGYAMPERVAGYDLVQEMLKISPAKNYKAYFFGSAPGIAAAAKAKAEKIYPGLEVVGIRDGYFQSGEEAAIIDDIRRADPDILLAALGVPKQEIWLKDHLAELKVPVAIGVGGTLDVMAGAVKRAPLWVQKAKLEWLYRGLKQPSRLGRLMALPKFVMKVTASRR